jgi:hypothetical protein
LKRLWCLRYTGEGSISLKKPTQLNDFELKFFHCPYRRNCVGAWGFYYKLLRVRNEWRHISKWNFSNLLSRICIWSRFILNFTNFGIFTSFELIVKLIIKLKKLSNYDIITKAHANCLLQSNIFRLIYIYIFNSGNIFDTTSPRAALSKIFAFYGDKFLTNSGFISSVEILANFMIKCKPGRRFPVIHFIKTGYGFVPIKLFINSPILFPKKSDIFNYEKLTKKISFYNPLYS